MKYLKRFFCLLTVVLLSLALLAGCASPDNPDSDLDETDLVIECDYAGDIARNREMIPILVRHDQEAIYMLRMKKKKWFLAAISAVLSIICAVVILRNPFSSSAVLWMFTGISLIVEAVFDVVSLIMNTRKEKADAGKTEEKETV